MLRFHTQTAGSTLTAQQPENNVVRVTLQALAAVLGGTQSLHTNSRDEAVSLPTAESVQIALRTQQIIAHESGVANTVDPLAGSYYVEYLTNEIERQVMEYVHKIDQLGGMRTAIEQGYVQGEIQNSAYAHQIAVEQARADRCRRQPVYRLQKSSPSTCCTLTPLSAISRETGWPRCVRERDASARRARRWSALNAAAQGDANLMPYVLDCVQAYATLGEMCDVLRDVFGEYRPECVF